MHRHLTSFTWRVLPVWIAALPLWSCSSDTLHRRNRGELAASLAALDQGDFRAATQRLDRLIAATNAEADQYRLQRFFAAFLLAQAHLRASGEGGYLSDGQAAQRVSLGQASVLSSESGGSVAHVVASMYPIQHGESWYAENLRLQVDGDAVLPEELESFGAQRAWVNLKLCQVAVYQRLGFGGRVDQLVNPKSGELAGVSDLEQCSQALVDKRVPGCLWASIYFAIFEVLRDEDPINAYRFGVQSIHGADFPAGAAARRDAIAAVSEWIEQAEFDWICPNCAQQAKVDTELCVACNLEHTIDFTQRRKPSQP